MRHQVKKHKKFNNKDKNHRDAMLRNLAGQLFVHKSITTTQKRAKAVAPMIDSLIKVAKGENEMNAIRSARAVLFTDEACKALFEVAKKQKSDSGFTRITPLGFRDGDNAKEVKLELV